MSDKYTLDELHMQEKELQFPFFDENVAWMLGSLVHEKAQANTFPIAIEITKGGQQVFFAALAGATPDNTEWIRKKRSVVQRFHHSSLFMAVQAEQQNRPFLQRYALSDQDYAASGGGFPIFVKKCGCVGTVVVSGLPQLDDHRLVIESIREIISKLAV
jgi:uncharacterized protein (UPF0303 family)